MPLYHKAFTPGFGINDAPEPLNVASTMFALRCQLLDGDGGGNGNGSLSLGSTVAHFYSKSGTENFLVLLVKRCAISDTLGKKLASAMWKKIAPLLETGAWSKKACSKHVRAMRKETVSTLLADFGTSLRERCPIPWLAVYRVCPPVEAKRASLPVKIQAPAKKRPVFSFPWSCMSKKRAQAQIPAEEIVKEAQLRSFDLISSWTHSADDAALRSVQDGSVASFLANHAPAAQGQHAVQLKCSVSGIEEMRIETFDSGFLVAIPVPLGSALLIDACIARFYGKMKRLCEAFNS